MGILKYEIISFKKKKNCIVQDQKNIDCIIIIIIGITITVDITVTITITITNDK